MSLSLNISFPLSLSSSLPSYSLSPNTTSFNKTIYLTLIHPSFLLLLPSHTHSLSFNQVRGYVGTNWKALTTPGQCMPAYIQLDHVYGLEGFELNMSPYPRSITYPTSCPSSYPSTCPSSSSSFTTSTSSTTSPHTDTSFSSSPTSSSSSASSTYSPTDTIYHLNVPSYERMSHQDIDSTSMSISLCDTLPLSLPLPPLLSLPLPLPTPQVKKSFVHYMFPTKRPRFIVQR